MMNPEVKVKWLEALRSGEYRQTCSTLRSNTGEFCCLGVLSDLYRKEVEGSWKWDYNGDKAYSIVNKNEDDFGTVLLPECIKDWAEVESCDPHVYVVDREDNDFEFVSLSELNDEGKTFNKIADLIDRNL